MEKLFNPMNIGGNFESMNPMHLRDPYKMYPDEREQLHRAEIEHAPNIAVRMNSNFRMEYYNEITGEIVSCHI